MFQPKIVIFDSQEKKLRYHVHIDSSGKEIIGCSKHNYNGTVKK